MEQLSILERAYRRATKSMPAPVAAKLDLMRSSYRRGWGGPMNGQESRRRVVQSLFAAIPFDEVVETGTFRGHTTRWLQEVSGLPVESVETVERFYLFAQDQCQENPAIRIHLGDSREFLRRLAARPEDHCTFFYLDAHWEEDVPRHDELIIVRDRWTDAVVMIDDFAVPGDDGYGFALYGGEPLNEKYLPDMAGWKLFYPTTPSAMETGARRGCAVFASPSLVEKVAAIEGLRPAG